MEWANALYTPEQVRTLDRLAMEVLDVDGEELMERAGRSAWRALQRRWPAAGLVTVLCGGGNNGGDGYVVARLAHRAGCRAEVVWLKAPEELRGAAAVHAERAREVGVPMRAWEDAGPRALDAGWGGSGEGEHVLVDALLGTGLDREVRGPARDAIAAMNHAGAPVLCIDVPSGLDARTGEALGAAVDGNHTVTFIAMKCGLLTGRGPHCTGSLEFAGLDVDAALAAHLRAHPDPDLQPFAERVDRRRLAPVLPARTVDAHKGDCGHVLVVGGDHGMGGAVRLAAEAALRTGSGLVSVATREGHVAPLLAGRPEIMAHSVEGAGDLGPLLDRADAVAVGPGLGTGTWSRELLAAVLERGLPGVLDADALNLLAAEGHSVDGTVLTPHPGEARRLLGGERLDRFETARRIARERGATVLLKGAGSIVDDGATRAVVTTGNPGMASAGMGDALTGVVVSLLGQGVAPWEAAVLGGWVHGAAGDRAAEDLGPRGLLAGDLIARLPRSLPTA